MKLFPKIILILILAISSLFAQNTYPIVLVHGFMGWGPEEMIGYNYWGGLWDLEEYLEEQGYTVYTVSIGPVSSNWERALEVCYQIKGGQVNYGKSHADKHGVIQIPEGKVFPGLYPDWDAEHPVHLIGHSMGGQTVRMLDYLQENVFHEDSMNASLENSAILGKSQSGWIKSITTISTPHNGTTYFDVRLKTLPFFQNFIGLAAVIGSGFYDFDLQHWDLEQKEYESWQEYYERVKKNSAWVSNNVSTWNLNINGAREANTLVKANPNVYYFSFATSCSIKDEITGFYLPKGKIFLSLRANVKQIGQAISTFNDSTKTDSTWFENDGVVNTSSMWRPTTGLSGADSALKYVEGMQLSTGKWHTFGPYKMDHYYVVGHGVFTRKQRDKLFKIYTDHCQLLYSLPQ